MRALFTLGRLLSMLLIAPGALASSALAEAPETTWEPLEVPLDAPVSLRGVTLLARASSGPALLIEPVGAATELWKLAEREFQPVTSVALARGALSERDGIFYACTGPDIVVQRWDGRSWAQVGGDIARETGFASRRGYDNCAVTFDQTGALLVVWQIKTGAKLWRTSAARWDGVAGRWYGLSDGLSTGQAAGFEIDPRAAAGMVLAYGINGLAASRRVLTRVYHWDGKTLSQLGADNDLGSRALAFAVYQQTPYVVLGAAQGSAHELGLYRWADAHWERVASIPGSSLIKLTFTLGGRPLIVAQELAEDGQSQTVLSVVDGATLQPLGVLPRTPGASVESVDVDVDASGRPIVAWTEQIPGLSADDVASQVKAARLSVPIP